VKLTFDNLDGNGAADYSDYVCSDHSAGAAFEFRIERNLNAPSRCSGVLAVGDAGLPVPVRRARVVVTSDPSGTDAPVILFTGYVATEPQQIYAGMGTEGPVYRTAFRAVSDEWLLDRATGLARGAGLGQSSGQVLTALTSHLGAGLVTTAGVASGRGIGVFVPDAAVNWSGNAAQVASSSYAAYRVLDGALTLQPVGATTHTFGDGDGTLQLGGLRHAAVKELANDVTVSGEMEPAAYVTERFAGDGTTAVFQLSDRPLRRPRPVLLSESFDSGVFNPRIWSVTDAGSRLGFGAHGLAMSGGNGFDGQTTLTMIDLVEMGGTLVVEAGGVRLDTASDGVLCGLYGGAISRANCFAGYNVRQSAGTTLVVPFVNGAEIGTSLVALAGHAYTLRIRLHCAEMERVGQRYYTSVDGVVQSFGGLLTAAPMAVVFELQDLGVSSNTPAMVLYDGVVATSPPTCTFAAVNSVQLFGSMAFCRITQTGSAWVVSTLATGVPVTRLMGVAGEGVDCFINATGLVTFMAGRIPLPGEIVTVLYRKARRAVARLVDATSVAAEAGDGMSGSARWLGRVTGPPARSSVDCENAALAILSFATSRSAAIAGSYDVVNPEDIWPGDSLDLVREGQTTNVLVRRVVIVDHMSAPEVLTYRVEFANDWAEGLGLTLSEAIATDALLPDVAMNEPGAVLANLQQLQIVSSTETALQIDAGTAAPAGGGFEVRRRDWNFGPGVDQDLVLRSPVRGFTIPREGQVERYFVRMFDGSTPPLYSRFSSAVVTNLPVG
jgi:hypothetical protein